MQLNKKDLKRVPKFLAWHVENECDHDDAEEQKKCTNCNISKFDWDGISEMQGTEFHMTEKSMIEELTKYGHEMDKDSATILVFELVPKIIRVEKKVSVKVTRQT